jgi:hypothetical protein
MKRQRPAHWNLPLTLVAVMLATAVVLELVRFGRPEWLPKLPLLACLLLACGPSSRR